MASGNEPCPNVPIIFETCDDVVTTKVIDLTSVYRKYYLLFVANGLYFIIAWGGSAQMLPILQPTINVTVTLSGKKITITNGNQGELLKYVLLQINPEI